MIWDNLTGQATVERAHYALKNQLLKQKGGMAGKSPPAHLQIALLTLKFFITDNQKFTQVRNTIHIPLQCNTHRRWVVQPPRKVPEGGPWEGPTPHTNLG